MTDSNLKSGMLFVRVSGQENKVKAYIEKSLD
jgi:phosphomannomutase